MFVIAGLGNPGSKYQNNRHNIGFIVIEELVRHFNLGMARSRFDAHVYEGGVGTYKVALLKPQTYMNHSGRSIGQFVNYFKLSISNVIVIHDDLDLETGRVRIKMGGGNGGHNGLKSIDSHIGTEYKRIRIGIGHPGHKDQVSNYVLSDFSSKDKEVLEGLVYQICVQLPILLEGNMVEYHNRVLRGLPDLGK